MIAEELIQFLYLKINCLNQEADMSCAYELTADVRACTRTLQAQATPNTRMARGGWHAYLPLAEALLIIVGG